MINKGVRHRINFLAAALVLLAAPAPASAPDAFFDAAGPAAVVFPPAAAAPAGRLAAPKQPPPIPPALVAAGGRVGTAAMLAKLPARGASETFSFGVIGDAEPGRFSWERIFNPGGDSFVRQWLALQPRVDLVLQLGDFVSEGDAAHYARHVDLIERNAAKPILHAVGNHDRSRPNGAADKRLWDAVYGARDYFFDHGGWRFVSVDSSDRQLAPAQLAWLAGVLSAPGPKVVYTHVPPAFLGKVAPLAAVGPSAPALPRFGPKPQGGLDDFFNNYFDEGAAEFERLVSAGGVKAVYMGHIHAFWAGDHRGVRYVISGGGGSPLYPLPPGFPQRRFAHALLVEAGPAGLRHTVVPQQGAPFVLP